MCVLNHGSDCIIVLQQLHEAFVLLRVPWTLKAGLSPGHPSRPRHAAHPTWVLSRRSIRQWEQWSSVSAQRPGAKTRLASPHDGLRPGRDFKLVEDGGHLVADSFFPQAEMRSNLEIVQSMRQ